MKYVVGFLFCRNTNQIVLLRKNTQDWQHDMLNGIGGKIEGNETCLDAMKREWKEETQDDTDIEWFQFANLLGKTSVVYCFKAEVDTLPILPSENDVGEEIIIMDLDDAIQSSFVVNNLTWLLPLAFNDRNVKVVASF